MIHSKTEHHFAIGKKQSNLNFDTFQQTRNKRPANMQRSAMALSLFVKQKNLKLQ